MSKNLKRFLYTSGIILIVILLGYGVGAFFIRAKIDTAVEEALPQGYAISYDKSSFNLWTASYALKQPNIQISDSADASKNVLSFQADALALKGIHYWDYLTKDAIRINRLQLDHPTVAYYTTRNFPASKTKENDSNKTFQIKNIMLQHANISLLTQEDSIKAYFSNVSAAINDIAPIQKNIPTYEKISFNADSTFLQLNQFDQLTTATITLKNNRLALDRFALNTQVSRTQLSQRAPREKDHYDIKIPKLLFEGFQGKKETKQWGVFAKSLLISQPEIDIYRDKRLPDDTRFKPMFGQLLRELPFPMAIDSVDVADLSLVYREKVTTPEPPGEVTFQRFKGTIAHVGNTYPDSTSTRIKVNSDIFETTPITASWTFRVQDTLDRFTFECEAGAFNAQVMNSFTIPSSRMALEGSINKTYFTITGNDDQGHINLKTRFNNFKIRMLEKDRRDTKELTNLLANAIVNKESSDEDDGFKEGTTTTSRVKNKSAFNYIWINIMGGLRKAVLDHNDDDD
tara:strand:+ start:12770 stop:14314 length:1545 start_codon:yes stop_codon:yes gene_type:complete